MQGNYNPRNYNQRNQNQGNPIITMKPNVLTNMLLNSGAITRNGSQCELGPNATTIQDLKAAVKHEKTFLEEGLSRARSGVIQLVLKMILAGVVQDILLTVASYILTLAFHINFLLKPFVLAILAINVAEAYIGYKTNSCFKNYSLSKDNVDDANRLSSQLNQERFDDRSPVSIQLLAAEQRSSGGCGCSQGEPLNCDLDCWCNLFDLFNC